MATGSNTDYEELDCRMSSYAGPRRLLHWGPIVAIVITLWIAIFTVYCDLMYWPLDKDGGCVNLATFLLWVFLILYHHYNASAIGPGYVPRGWKPKDVPALQKLQYCKVCDGYKAPRSHHCRKCGRCVMKMDHHCPWINCCTGHMNHSSFTYFLFFAPIGCTHAFFILVMSLYYGFNVKYYLHYGNGKAPLVLFGLPSLVGSMFAVGLAFGVTLSVGALFIIQFRGIWRNRTGIEDWIEQKAEYRELEEGEREFVYPYDVGCRRNFAQVFWGPDGWPRSNGFWWEIRDGATQFDLSVEQLKQKREKQSRIVEYKAVKAYSGYFLPITQGCCVCLCFPWSDEPRISLQPGDRLSVTRWRKHWLYGDKHIRSAANDDFSYRRERGWFPRRCAIKLTTEEAGGDSNKEKDE